MNGEMMSDSNVPIDSIRSMDVSQRSLSGVLRRDDGKADSKMYDDIDIPLPRLVCRNLPYSQSLNRIQVKHNYNFMKIYKLIQHDWFHVLLRRSTTVSLFFLLSIWTIALVVWAGMYVWIDRSNIGVKCGLGPNGTSISFRGAFAFSLQTSTTVGYTLPSGSNAFFEHCPGIQTTIYLQMVFSMMFNAFLFAFFYTRIGKADSRGNQVLFSSKAIVSCIDGQVRFQVRMFDVDATKPVVEAHIRMYVVLKSKPVPRRLRLLQPNDEFQSMLFLSLPAVASHHIDIYSLLHPPRIQPIPPTGLTLRQVDSATTMRHDVICPVCGEDYGTYERWVNHVKYLTISELAGGSKKSERLHCTLPKSKYLTAPPDDTIATTDINVLKAYFAQEISEVICVVEGIEPISSGSFSAMQSYRYDDIIFKDGTTFKSCVENVGDGLIRIDLDRFQEFDNVKVSNRVRSNRRWQSMRGHDGVFFRKTKHSMHGSSNSTSYIDH